MRACSASGVKSTITVSSAVSGTQSGTVSRTVIPVIERTVGAMLSMCWIFSVDTTSIFAAEQSPARPRSACGVCCREYWCAPVRPPAPLAAAAPGWHPRPSLRKSCLCTPICSRGTARDLRYQFFDAFASVRLHHADHHVFAAALPPNRLRSACCRFCPRPAHSREIV